VSKVLFISFQENTDVIGVKYLDAVLREAGHASTILLVPNSNSANIAGAISHIIETAPQLIAISAMSYEYQRAREFVGQLKQQLTGTPVVIGGIHATTDPVSCLEFSDVVVRGEGEETLIELLPVLTGEAPRRLSEISGIVYLDDDRKPHYTTVRQPVADLDALPSIAHLPESMWVMHGGLPLPIAHPVIVKRYVRYQGTVLSVVSSRGCPFSCRYCCNSALKSLYGRTSVRPRSVDLVIAEIVREVELNKNILYVNFQDDCFMMHRTEWLAEFADRYKTEVAIPFIVRTTPRHISKEKLALLKAAYLRWVFMGLQTGSDRINKEVYGRNVTSQQFIKARSLVAESGISIWIDVILDNPYETEAENLETIDLLLKIERPYQLDIFSLDYFPGTELYEQVKAENIPVPALGEKSYTEPEARMINRYIRMSATLPRWLVRSLVGQRKTKIGRRLGMLGYYLCLATEPFIYVWLILISQDFKIVPTLKTIATFYETAFNKLILRKQG
jgi:radical SAM superfamily enzyme YgiQ (UPF0313 family)